MSSTQRLYRTLHDQLDQALYPAALKTCTKILRVEPLDTLALTTRLQLLLALERYPEAIRVKETVDPVERAYSLYKSARAAQAKTLLESDQVDVEEDRGAKVLLAQVDYRLGNYEASRDAFDDLANSADLDSPELDDLQHNSEQCSAKLAFLTSVPSLASASEPIEQLEVRPLTTVLPLPPRVRMHHPLASTSTLKPTSSSGEATPPKSRGKKPLKKFDPVTRPVEDRWIPKRQRPSMRDQLLQNKEKQRGKKRDKVLAMTQGASEESKPTSNAPATPSRGGTSANKGAKKKKGKK